MHPHDQQIVESLLARDEKVTRDFFYLWCRPLLSSLIRKIFPYEVDYDELVNELYLYLMENDGHRLRTFQGRSSIYQWLKCVATRFFLDKRDAGEVIEDSSCDPLFKTEVIQVDAQEEAAVRQDLSKMLSLMHTPRYRLVITRLFLEGYDYKELAQELDITVANLYNIKKRAMSEFAAIVIKEYGN